MTGLFSGVWGDEGAGAESMIITESSSSSSLAGGDEEEERSIVSTVCVSRGDCVGDSTDRLRESTWRDVRRLLRELSSPSLNGLGRVLLASGEPAPSFNSVSGDLDSRSIWLPGWTKAGIEERRVLSLSWAGSTGKGSAKLACA